MRRTFVWVPLLGVIVSAWPLLSDAAELCRVEPGHFDAVRLTNLSSGAPPSELPFGDAGVQRVAVSPDGDLAYVAIGGRFSVVDLGTLDVIDRFELPIPILRMLVGPDGRLHTFEFDGLAAYIRSIDPQTHAQAQAIPLPEGTREVRGLSLGGNGRWLFAQAYDGTSQVVSVIDLQQRRVIASHPLPAVWYMSSEVVASPTGDFAYLVEAEERGVREGGLWLIPLAGEPRKLGVPLATGGVTFAPDGERAFILLQAVVDGDDPTIVIDTSTHSAIGVLPSGNIAGFEASGCVIVSGARVARRACLGDASSAPVSGDDLSPRTVVPNARDGIAPTLWTDGPCSLPPRGCPDDSACLALTGGRGVAGETVAVRARLQSHGETISAIQADLYADLALPFAFGARAGDRANVNCTVNPAIDKPHSVWSCLEPGGAGCASLRSVVISLIGVDAIDDGAELYTCDVPIPADAAPGTYPIGCGYSGASDPDGVAVPLFCDAGSIEVVADGSGAEPQLSGSGGQSGCQVDARPSSNAAAPLLLAPLLLLLRRRAARPALAMRRGAVGSRCDSSLPRRAGR
jgi:DNA-binding beta-propeller fold protein YncE